MSTPAAPSEVLVTDSDNGPDRPPRIALFCFAWALYALLHQLLTYSRWLGRSDLAALTTILAAWVLLKPTSLWRFVALLLAWSAYKFRLLPYVANHILFTLLVNLTMLIAIGWRVLIPRAGKSRGQAGFEDYAPLIRWELLALYFWVVFHKLNVDFLNPEVSCGWALYEEIREIIPVMPVFPGLPFLAIYGTLAIEAAIPIMLAFRRTRTWGVLLGCVFHVMLSLHANVFITSFTCMLFAIYTLFWPASWVESAYDSWSGSKIGRIVSKRAFVIAGGAVAVFGMVVLGVAWATNGISKASILDALHMVAPATIRTIAFAYFAAALFWIARQTVKQRVLGDPRLLRPHLTPAALLVIVVALNGFSPYLGIRNQSSFAMFSNLRTSGGSTNHLFMPVSFRLSDRQDDIVTIVRSNDERLNEIQQQGDDLTWFEFRRLLSIRSDGFTVTYTRNGETQTLSLPADAEHEAFVPPPRWQRKLLWINPVAPRDRPCRCRH